MTINITKNIEMTFSVMIGIIAALFLITSPVFASSSCAVTSPTGDIWYNKQNTVEIICTCPSGTTQLQNTYITKFYTTPVSFSGVDTTWKHTINVDQDRLELTKYGEYKIDGECLDLNYTKIGNFTGSFFVHQITGMVTYPSQSFPFETYLTNMTSIEYKLYKDGNLITVESLAQTGGSLNFEAYLNNEATTDKKIAYTNKASYDPAKESWIIPSYRFNTVEGLTSENTYNLKVLLTYSEQPDTTIIMPANTVSNAVNTKSSLVVSLVPGTLPKTLDLTGTTKKDIKLRVIYQGEPAENLDISHFDVYMQNKDGKRSANLIDENRFMYNDGDGYYLIPIDIIQQNPDTYELKISVWYAGVGEIILTAAHVNFVLAFQGQLADANGNVVSAMIVLKNNMTETPIATDSAGKYGVPISAGTYDISMRFPDIWKVELKGVDITSNTIDSINYDHLVSNSDIEGLTVAKLVVLEFALPFDSAYLEIPYNDAKIDNEKNIKTFECTYWNFGKRTCIGEWKEVSSVVNIVRDIVSFNTNLITAFVIGERRGLWLDASLEKRDYFANENIVLSGKVIDTKSNDIEGVEIHYTVEGTDISGKTTSGEGGIFTAILHAPSEGGIFKLIATTKRSPYVSYNTTYEFEVTKKREVNLQAPETVDVKIDEPITVPVTIFNTGQTELTNIKFSIAGLKETWYKLEPSIIENIPSGERRTVEVNIHVTSEECEIEDCGKYYFVNFDFTSNEINEKTAFTAKIKSNESFVDTPLNTEIESTIFSMPDITGFVSISSAGKTNIYLVFIFAVFGFVIITIKKRQKRLGRGRGFKSSRIPKARFNSTINNVKSMINKRR